jgi:hypothetical protein
MEKKVLIHILGQNVLLHCLKESITLKRFTKKKRIKFSAREQT